MKKAHLTALGAVTAVAGLAALLVGLVRGDLLSLCGGDLAGIVSGAGPIFELLGSGVALLAFGPMTDAMRTHGVAAGAGQGLPFLLIGLGLWVVGWASLAAGLQPEAAAAREPSAAVGKPLHPRLAQYRDFHWGTLAAYGFGIFFAEIALVLTYLVSVANGAAQGRATGAGLAPVWAFVLALTVGAAVAFVGGFLGAANSKRLSTPEATIALLYFGLPFIVLLTAMDHVPGLLQLRISLQEVVYLSQMLGEARPELGYWLVFIALCLALVLGINAGFVSTSTGKLDLRTSYELFVSSRHVAVFRWRLLLGVFAVLILGIVPPLLVFLMVMAAEKAVERTRVKRIGEKDPLLATEALHALKLKEQTPTAMMTTLSVGGVGVGVMALIVVLSVMSGFEADLQKKILGTNSHGVVMTYSPEMPKYQEAMEKIGQVHGIAGQTPFILNEVMISSDGNIAGSMIKGIDPATVGSVTDLPSYMLPGGSLEGLEDPKTIKVKRIDPLGDGAFDMKPAQGDAAHPKADKPAGKDKGLASDIERDPLIDLGDAAPANTAEAKKEEPLLPGIVIGRELAASMRVAVGDRLNVVSPLGGELGPQGPMPKSRPFRVAGIFYSGMYEYDSKFVYIHLREAQSFFGIKGASGIEVKVDDVDDARSIMKRVNDELGGYPIRTKDWGEMNRNLFAALRLEKLVMGIILSVIVIVAAGLIVATVIMLVLEKRKEIAVLKALGVPDGGIVKIFLSEGLQIGVAGGILGLIAGLNWCLFIEKVGIKLDPQVYYIPALPVRIEPLQTALSVVVAILVTFLASIYPALKAAQVEPVDGLKAE